MYGKKRVYIGVLTILTSAVIIFYLTLIYVLLTHNVGLYYYILIGIAAPLTVFLLILVVGTLAVVFSLLKKRPIRKLSDFMSFALNTIYPEVLFVGGLLGIEKEQMMRSFAEINNNLVAARNVKVAPDDILILLPHCLQRSTCVYRITTNINNCRRCGRCDIKGLIEISERYGVRIIAATGGTLARKAVKDYKPKAIVAVACERDLTSGIQDVNGIPVYGVINIRPEGPCYNTRVDLNLVESAVKNFIDGRYYQ
ncbi:DUF116 domain-containing protein [Calorimonas adulescens]|uniref:DUF116 domain-containing protein n=1 Tax=Calorimonas adulescens TaxID=2606906 RepID=A0A5D8QIT9_9THEO|nr:DUF116 domain-containing protein [Calorimonas adulescens]TZE83413.1 DUF116 domain-containing protein [Calorimonas adulescens]